LAEDHFSNAGARVRLGDGRWTQRRFSRRNRSRNPAGSKARDDSCSGIRPSPFFFAACVASRPAMV